MSTENAGMTLDDILNESDSDSDNAGSEASGELKTTSKEDHNMDLSQAKKNLPSKTTNKSKEIQDEDEGMFSKLTSVVKDAADVMTDTLDRGIDAI